MTNCGSDFFKIYHIGYLVKDKQKQTISKFLLFIHIFVFLNSSFQPKGSPATQPPKEMQHHWESGIAEKGIPCQRNAISLVSHVVMKG